MFVFLQQLYIFSLCVNFNFVLFGIFITFGCFKRLTSLNGSIYFETGTYVYQHLPMFNIIHYIQLL